MSSCHGGEETSLRLFQDLAVSSCCISQGKTFTPPSWAVPMNQFQSEGIAIHVIKQGEVIDTLKLDEDDRKYTLFGRCPSATSGNKSITLDHLTISRTHASILRSADGTCYIVDFGSVHGTFINGMRISPFIAMPLNNRTSIRFGLSTRLYLMRIFPKLTGPIQDEDMEARCNTLLNCMVGYKEASPEPCVAAEEKHPKLERRVSFSCLAPEIILIQDAHLSSSVLTPSTSACMFASPPEIKFRKSPKMLVDNEEQAKKDEEEEEFQLEPSNKRLREVVPFQ